MNKTNGEILRPVQKRPVKSTYFWLLISLAFFACGFLCELIHVSPEQISVLQPIVWICIEMLMILIFFHSNRTWILWIPIVLIAFFYTPLGILHGGMALIDHGILCFNTIHHVTLHTSDTVYTLQNIIGAISILTCGSIAYISNSLFHGHKWIKYMILFLYILWMLVIQNFSSFACACLFVGAWFPVFLNADHSLPRARYIGVGAFVLSVLVCGIAYGNIDSLTTIREKLKQDVHDVRYGKDVLPLGNLNDASLLHQENGKMLKVTSQYAKDLYLKAFTGSVYEDGKWEKMDDSVYELDNEGLLKWLENHNFDPLYQVSQYNELCEDNQFVENTLNIHVENASRESVYTPPSISSFQNIKVKEEYDQTFYSNNLIPKRNYTETELSGSNPSEIITTEDWVENPKTTAQKEYVEAESAYRSFVYDTYTKVNASVYASINDLFWKDYQTDTDSIYSAITHIRNRLSEISYQDTNVQSDADPLVLYLKGELPSDQLLMTTCAVEAMRAHGIPARYVEGYYVSSTALSHSSTVSLVAENAHVWMEVYFDGIGWLPIDVIPGFYKDAVSLRNMIGLPDAVHKSAMLSQDKMDAGEYDDSVQNTQDNEQDILSEISTIGKHLLGLVALFVLCVTCLICIFEIIRWFFLKYAKYKFNRLSYQQQAKVIHQMLIYVLALRGISTVIGWHTEESDRIISEKYADIQPGDYEKICALFEKVLYGNQQLEEYEQRTIQVILDIIFDNEEDMSLLSKCKKHCSVFYCMKVMYQLSKGKQRI